MRQESIFSGSYYFILELVFNSCIVSELQFVTCYLVGLGVFKWEGSSVYTAAVHRSAACEDRFQRDRENGLYLGSTQCSLLEALCVKFILQQLWHSWFHMKTKRIFLNHVNLLYSFKNSVKKANMQMFLVITEGLNPTEFTLKLGTCLLTKCILCILGSRGFVSRDNARINTCTHMHY